MLIEFMLCLLKDAQRKVFLILGDFGCIMPRWSKPGWKSTRTRSEVFYLPDHSPGLNTRGYLNCDLKTSVHSGKPARSEVQLRHKATRHKRILQLRSSQVRKYFEHEKIRYAA